LEQYDQTLGGKLSATSTIYYHILQNIAPEFELSEQLRNDSSVTIQTTSGITKNEW
jgi:hypothetical protein